MKGFGWFSKIFAPSALNESSLGIGRVESNGNVISFIEGNSILANIKVNLPFAVGLKGANGTNVF